MPPEAECVEWLDHREDPSEEHENLGALHLTDGNSQGMVWRRYISDADGEHRLLIVNLQGPAGGGIIVNLESGNESGPHTLATLAVALAGAGTVGTAEVTDTYNGSALAVEVIPLSTTFDVQEDNVLAEPDGEGQIPGNLPCGGLGLRYYGGEGDALTKSSGRGFYAAQS